MIIESIIKRMKKSCLIFIAVLSSTINFGQALKEFNCKNYNVKNSNPLENSSYWFTARYDPKSEYYVFRNRKAAALRSLCSAIEGTASFEHKVFGRYISDLELRYFKHFFAVNVLNLVDRDYYDRQAVCYYEWLNLLVSFKDDSGFFQCIDNGQTGIPILFKLFKYRYDRVINDLFSNLKNLPLLLYEADSVKVMNHHSKLDQEFYLYYNMTLLDYIDYQILFREPDPKLVSEDTILYHYYKWCKYYEQIERLGGIYTYDNYSPSPNKVCEICKKSIEKYEKEHDDIW